MSVTVVTPQSTARNAFDLDVVFTAATTAADGFTIDVSNVADQKLTLLFKNAGSTNRTATINAGNGLQGISALTSGNIGNAKIASITIESGKYKNVSGDNKGKIVVIPSHEELTMAAIYTP